MKSIDIFLILTVKGYFVQEHTILKILKRKATTTSRISQTSDNNQK